MGKKQSSLLLLVLVGCCAVLMVAGLHEGRRSTGKKLFILHEDEEVVRTEAGVIKVIKGINGRRSLHIGFITMEPQSLFIPQYLDSHLVLFIRHGEARIGHIYNDELAERKVKSGDIYTIEAGSAFYLVNTAEGQRLHIICSIDTSESIGWNTFQSFFIGGGMHPTSVLAGFDPSTLSTAFNISVGELGEFLSTKLSGPIVSLINPQSPTGFLGMRRDQRLALLKRIVHFEAVDEEEKNWLWLMIRKALTNPFSNKDKKGDAPDSYNLFDTDPDFRNEYGWSLALDEDDYAPLKIPDVTVYLVNLTAGSMMAPHINPRAIEYGIVLRGMGEIEIVYPNGTLAMTAQVREGDVFWVPRFFPFCQIASRNGPFVFFGFTTSAKDNKPQFLAGDGSLMELLRGPELATALGLSVERLGQFLDAQRASTILPAASAAPPEPMD